MEILVPGFSPDLSIVHCIHTGDRALLAANCQSQKYQPGERGREETNKCLDIIGPRLPVTTETHPELNLVLKAGEG